MGIVETAILKEKAKNFWERHKNAIIIGGIGSIVIVGAGVMSYKSYMDGFVDGGITGYHLCLKWLDETFPGESNARELFERYKVEHPDQIVYRKGPGKWS